MKITCTRERLVDAIGTAERISGKNLTLPVLNCVVLDVKGGVFKVKATNLELGIETVVPAECEGEAVIALSGSVLHGTLTSLADSKGVVLEEKAGNVLLKTQGGVSTLKSQTSEDFPTIPRVSGAETFTLPADDFVRGVRAVVYSASISAIKPEQASVYLYQEDNHLVFVATDSFRLAEKRIAVKGRLPEFDPVLIPARNVTEILRTLEQWGGDVTIELSTSQISFAVEGNYLTSRLVDGTFPDYRNVIPKASVTEAVVLKQDVVQVFKKLSIFADKSSQVSVHINPSKKSLNLEARNADVGETHDALHGAFTGDPLDINFNYRYIADCFPSIATDSVSLSFSGMGRPLVIRGVSDTSFLYLVMPMNK